MIRSWWTSLWILIGFLWPWPYFQGHTSTLNVKFWQKNNNKIQKKKNKKKKKKKKTIKKTHTKKQQQQQQQKKQQQQQKKKHLSYLLNQMMDSGQTLCIVSLG